MSKLPITFACGLYDRMLAQSNFAERPLRPGGPAKTTIPPPVSWGKPIIRSGNAANATRRGG